MKPRALAVDEPTITDADIELGAREELVSPNSVIRVLAGLDVRGLAGDRARRVVEKLRARRAADALGPRGRLEIR